MVVLRTVSAAISRALLKVLTSFLCMIAGRFRHPENRCKSSHLLEITSRIGKIYLLFLSQFTLKHNDFENCIEHVDNKHPYSNHHFRLLIEVNKYTQSGHGE